MREPTEKDRFEKKEEGIEVVASTAKSAIFPMFTKSSWSQIILGATGLHVLFPTMIVIYSIKYAYSLYAIHQRKQATRGVITGAILEGVALSLMIASVIVANVVGAALAIVSPILFVVSSALTTFKCIGLSIYHGYRYQKYKDPNDKLELQKNLVGAGLGALTTIGLSFVMLAKVIVVPAAIILTVVNVGSIFAFTASFLKEKGFFTAIARRFKGGKKEEVSEGKDDAPKLDVAPKLDLALKLDGAEEKDAPLESRPQPSVIEPKVMHGVTGDEILQQLKEAEHVDPNITPEKLPQQRQDDEPGRVVDIVVDIADMDNKIKEDIEESGPKLSD